MRESFLFDKIFFISSLFIINNKRTYNYALLSLLNHFLINSYGTEKCLVYDCKKFESPRKLIWKFD